MAKVTRKNKDSIPPSTMKDRFQAATKSLPMVLSVDDFVDSLVIVDLIAMESSVMVPDTVNHTILPKNITRETPGSLDQLVFEEKLLPPKVRTEVLRRCWAKDHNVNYIIECADGWIGVPKFESDDEYYYDSSRTCKSVADASFQLLLNEVRDIVKSVDNVSILSLKNVIRSTHAIFSLTSEVLSTIIDQVKSIKEITLDEIDTLPETLEEVQQFSKSLSLITGLVSLKLSCHDVEDYISAIESSSMNDLHKLRLVAMHPKMVLPLAVPKTPYYTNSGAEATSMKISDLSDSDSVLCTSAYITEMGLKSISANTIVYTQEVYKSKGKKRGTKEPILHDEPISKLFLSSKALQSIVTMNKSGAVKVKEEKTATKRKYDVAELADFL